MSDHERLEVLRRVPELSLLAEGTLRALLPWFDEVAIPAGVVLAEAGLLCHEFVVVAAGELEACRWGRASLHGRGDAFGWEAMRGRGRHDATLVTRSPSRVLVMSHAQFRAVEGLVAASVCSDTPSAARIRAGAQTRPC
ncbi:MAG TPA: cyclic nucleotide-binding domain-containing protein [Candidatus Dormibacteraeota bacterium]|nr:cyclic nucleotide-binding domain-containing protein [Candidatus Dormibacteraeota bacterium]